MKFDLKKPKQSLNKSYLKEKLSRSAIELFKQNFQVFLDNTSSNKNDEEHLKSQVIYFLRDTWYQDSHQINPIGKNDLVIHTGKNTSDPVGVIVEVKSITNKGEMVSLEKPNVKALHELVLYYLRERIEQNNNEVKFLVATNIEEWFVIDANEFDKKIFRNTAIKRLYELKKADNKDNPWFYDELKKLLQRQDDLKLEITHFNINDFKKVVTNGDHRDDNKLIAVYKLLSPVHLLKLPFANDSNSLQPRFYAELLHIIGLAEVKEGSKKLIRRKAAGERNHGSLLENTIVALDTHDKISRLDRPTQYGENYQDRLFAVALELVITWVNRILFLKLLEAQLLSYHKGDRSYRFLSKDKIKDFDDLDKLFFRVLAKRNAERQPEIQQLFGKVPYLNSSLFEPTDLEHQTLFINGLEDRVLLPLIGSTVLKNEAGKTLKGSLPTIDYLFAFLDAYDFSSEGAEEIQEDNKTLINASVLGLIFEKINGYKDGSFFTPGFITMYMCRETIRRAVVQKFNEVKGWDLKEYDELYDKISDNKEANEIVNSLKICDPAVGSGHFLVSALNEILAIKSDLRILLDTEGRRLKEYTVEVVNDELVVTDEEGQLFDYKPGSKESQRVQETLFHEKQTIIENCLFGVDINPNSVKICRLRLWIELLKNAYYRSNGELETLPNIDINIKTGNSLISRFALDSDLKQALKKSRFSIDVYKIAVQTYRNAKDKEEKREMERLIASIKSDFRSEIGKNDPKLIKLNRLGGELYNLTSQHQLFGESKVQAKARKARIEKLEKEIKSLSVEVEEIKSNKIYENAFEWRFEFPEVLNDEGDFVGFDVVIGNPPYIRQEEIADLKKYLASHYSCFNGMADLFVYFIELGLNRLKTNGNFSFIIPNKWMKAGYGKQIREQIKALRIEKVIDFGDLPVFEEATTYPCILEVTKRKALSGFPVAKVIDLRLPFGLNAFFSENKIEVQVQDLGQDSWHLAEGINRGIINKIKSIGIPLGEFVKGNIYRGILTGFNEAFIIDEKTKDRLISEDPKSDELIKPFLDGRDIKRYGIPKVKKWIIFARRGIHITSYQAIEQHLQIYREYLQPRSRTASLGKGRKPGNYQWYEIQDSIEYHQKFEEDKIAWAETSLGNQFCLVSKGIYLNKTSFMIPSSNLPLLAILNSTLAKFYFSSIVSKVRGGYFSMSKSYVETFPVLYPKDDCRFAQLTTEMIECTKQNDPESLKRVNGMIDQLVYQLYGLTEEEIKIIEGEA